MAEPQHSDLEKLILTALKIRLKKGRVRTLSTYIDREAETVPLTTKALVVFIANSLSASLTGKYALPYDVKKSFGEAVIYQFENFGKQFDEKLAILFMAEAWNEILTSGNMDIRSSEIELQSLLNMHGDSAVLDCFEFGAVLKANAIKSMGQNAGLKVQRRMEGNKHATRLRR